MSNDAILHCQTGPPFTLVMASCLPSCSAIALNDIGILGPISKKDLFPGWVIPIIQIRRRWDGELFIVDRQVLGTRIWIVLKIPQ